MAESKGDGKGSLADSAPLPDEDMDALRPGKRGSDGGAPSPQRQRPAPLAVDVETLRGLLAEQSAQLLEKVMKGQREQVENMATELRTEMQAGHETISQEVRAQGQQLKELQGDHRQVLQRLEKLEREGSTEGLSWTNFIKRYEISILRGSRTFRGSPPVPEEQLHSCNLRSGTTSNTRA